MKRLYSVRDVKADAFGPVMAFGHDAVAVRSFDDLLQAEGTITARHPEDFELVEVGAFWDDEAPGREDGLRVVGVKPRVIVTGAALQAMRAQGPQLAKEG